MDREGVAFGARKGVAEVAITFRDDPGAEEEDKANWAEGAAAAAFSLASLACREASTRARRWTTVADALAVLDAETDMEGTAVVPAAAAFSAAANL